MQLHLSTLNKTSWLAILAVGAMQVTVLPGHAAGTFTTGDLVFGVRDTNPSDSGYNNTYLIDLGAPPPGSTTIAAGLNADLTALFGSSWYTNPNLQWGIEGFKSLGSTVYISEAESTYGTESTPYGNSGLGSTQRSSIESYFTSATSTAHTTGSNIVGFTSSGATVNGVSVAGVGQLESTNNTWASYLDGGSNFATIGNSDWGFFGQSDLATGFSGSALDMYAINGTGSSQNIYDGSFTVTSGGAVDFSASPPGAAPEPGRAALLGLGFAGLFFRRRRVARVA